MTRREKAYLAFIAVLNIYSFLVLGLNVGIAQKCLASLWLGLFLTFSSLVSVGSLLGAGRE